jgi:hypothetical protein
MSRTISEQIFPFPLAQHLADHPPMTDPLLEPIGALPSPGSIGPNLPGLEVRIGAGRHYRPPRDTTYDVESAKGDGRTVQRSLLIMVPITPGRAGDLERLLAAIAFPPGGEDLELNPVIPFRKLESVHFARILARQFEFVQSTWVNNMKFDGLYADGDPVAAPHVDAAAARHDEEVGQFTIQGCPVRHRVSRLPPFVRMVGGAYLFMPGLKTLEFLAQT